MDRKAGAVRLGIIADTHGLFDRAILRHFQGVDRILHAGDIGDRAVLRQLEAIAPVTAVSGNVDGYEDSGFRKQAVIELAGQRIGLRHILYEGGKLTRDGRTFLDEQRPDLCIFGHTHQPTVEQYAHILLCNPGSAGPKRFTLPRGLGLIVIEDGRISPQLIRLADRAE